MKFVLGKKLGMSTIYNEDGAQNVTLLEVPENVVDMIRTEEKDGYNAIRVMTQKTNKKELQKEFRVETIEGFEVGQKVGADAFQEGDEITVTAPTKAKGFQGVVKRHGFKGGPASHGHRHVLRRPGSIGSAFPQHVIKGKRMAGRTGGKNATIQGIKVVRVDAERNILAIKGTVPGVAGRFVEIVSFS